LYGKYLTEGKDKVMAVHTMMALWEWKHGSTHSYTRHYFNIQRTVRRDIFL